MNGGQDLGGMMGFGAVQPEPDPQASSGSHFHEPWEESAFALTLAAGALGLWSIDEARHARESLQPGDYLTSSYYQIWFKGLERLLLTHGLVSQEELASGRQQQPPRPVRPLRAAQVGPTLARGSPYSRPADTPGRHRVGDVVCTRNVHPSGHTRLPRYARGKTGVIDRCHGVFVFADTQAAGLGESPQWLYTVRFAAEELWGESACPGLTVSIDAWESYLVAA
ncbi:MAG: nitrile hydratase subunit beta [Lautropia sp.]|nr:nitrile hydratase subunit beta [Lautropia sp.]